MPDKTPSSRKASLPDLYRQLGLRPLENDRGRIEAAVKKLLAGAAVADPGKAKRIAAVVELSQRHLLEPDRKQIYDRQWARVFSDSMPSARAKKPDSAVHTGAQEDQAAQVVPMRPLGSPGGLGQTGGKALESLQSYLPAADPLAAFRPTSTPAGIPQPQQDAADFAELQEYFMRPWEGMKSAASGFSPPSSATSVSTSAAALAASADGLQAAPLRAQRKRLENSFVGGILALLACLAIVLGGIYWFTRPEAQQTPPTAFNSHNAAQHQASNPDVADQSANTSPGIVRRSGLPPVPGLQPPPGEPETQFPSELSRPNESATAQETTQVDTANDTPAPVASQGMPSALRPTGQAAPGPNTASMPESEPLEMTPEPLATPPASAPLTGAELVAWQEKLDSVRNLLGQQEYSAAYQRLDALDAVSRNTPQRAQWQRLRLLTELAEELKDYLVRAVDGLGAGETVTIGSSTQASFVEGSPNRIVVRIRGQNQGFSWTELPIGLVYALVDLVMDVEHPRSKACKAAFTLVHPASKNNELALLRARGFMSEAISAGSIPSDMLELFE